MSRGLLSNQVDSVWSRGCGYKLVTKCGRDRTRFMRLVCFLGDVRFKNIDIQILV